jgi:23S rRNA pseudouridine2605 synthase
MAKTGNSGGKGRKSAYKEKRSFSKNKELGGERSSRKSGDGDRPAFRKRAAGEAGSRFNADKSFPKRDGVYGKSRDGGDKPAFRKRDGGEDSGFRKRRDDGDKPAFRKRDSGDGGFRKRSDDGDKPAYRKRDSEEGGFRKRRDDGDRPAFKRRDGDSRSFRRRSDDGEKKTYTRGGEEKSFRSRREDGDEKSFRGKRDDGDKHSFRKRDDGDRPFRKGTEERSGGFRKARRDDDTPPVRRSRSEGELANWGDDGAEEPSFRKKVVDGDSERPARRSTGERSDYRKSRRDDDTGYRGKGKSDRFSKKGKASGPKSLAGEDGLIRLNKYLSNSGIASRRDADVLISSGAVKVNGEVVTQLGHKIKPGDKVTYGDEAVKGEKKVYILLNKPKDYITTVDDPRERRTVMHLIEGACRERVYPVGRLDRNTTGVLLLTNDGEITARLTHPKFGVKKIYHVTLNKGLRADHFREIIEGVELEDGKIQADDLQFPGESRKEVGIEIHSGRNRIVRRLFEHLGYEVIKLDRVSFAGLTKKDISRGKWRFLSPKEINFLHMK